MTVKKVIEAGQLAPGSVTIPVAVVIVVPPVAVGIMPFVALFAVLKGIGVFFDLLAHLRMLLEILLQLAVVLDEFRVVHQGWILPKLPGNLGMAVEEAIEVGQLPSSGIAGLGLRSYGLSTCGRNRDQSRQSNERE